MYHDVVHAWWPASTKMSLEVRSIKDDGRNGIYCTVVEPEAGENWASLHDSDTREGTWGTQEQGGGQSTLTSSFAHECNKRWTLNFWGCAALIQSLRRIFKFHSQIKRAPSLCAIYFWPPRSSLSLFLLPLNCERVVNSIMEWVVGLRNLSIVAHDTWWWSQSYDFMLIPSKWL